MADGYEGFDRSLDYHEGGGGSFVMGLLTGTVLGAGLGMLFAPRAGSEMRHRLSEQASEGYRRASETAGQLAERGREMYNKASDAVAKGVDEAQRYTRDAERSLSGADSPSSGAGPSTIGSQGGSTGYGTGSSYGSSSERIRGSASEESTRPLGSTDPNRPRRS